MMALEALRVKLRAAYGSDLCYHAHYPVNRNIRALLYHVDMSSAFTDFCLHSGVSFPKPLLAVGGAKNPRDKDLFLETGWLCTDMVWAKLSSRRFCRLFDMHDCRNNAREAVFDEESGGLNDAGDDDWGETAKRVSRSKQLHVSISKHTNYVLWPLMSHGSDCQTLASPSLRANQAFIGSPLCGLNFIHRLHLSNRHARRKHTQAHAHIHVHTGK